MADMIARAEAEYEAEQVVKANGFTTLPVCPFTIAGKAGIVVEPKETQEPGVSGFLMRVGDTFGIRYASHIQNEGFIRFTIAHELGHYFLPGHPEKLFAGEENLHQSRSGFISHDPLERQADFFASALLMPEKMFRNVVDGAGTGISAIKKLSKHCKTSITATAIRFTIFTGEPVAVIVSSKDRVEYCFLSEKLKDVHGLNWLRKGDLIAPRSSTAQFNNNPVNVSKAHQIDGYCFLDDWFDGAPQIEMNEDVVGLGNYGKTLTVLSTDEEFEDEEDDFDA